MIIGEENSAISPRTKWLQAKRLQAKRLQPHLKKENDLNSTWVKGPSVCYLQNCNLEYGNTDSELFLYCKGFKFSVTILSMEGNVLFVCVCGGGGTLIVSQTWWEKYSGCEQAHAHCI